jgi:hypothetical protein
MSHERAVELLQIFDDFDGEYKRAEVEVALTLREEMIPLLIRHLEELAKAPDEYIETGRFAHNYALALLAHFREPSAHLAIIRAFSLSYKQLDAIWGELLTEGLPALLCRTSGGNYDAVKALALERGGDQFVRSAALEAIKLAVAQGDLSRDDALDFYATLFDEDNLAQPEDYFWPALVFELCDLYPVELMDKVRELYAKGLVTDEYMPLEDFEVIVEGGLEKALARLKARYAERSLEDVHAYISWFACFDENAPDWDDEDFDDFDDEPTIADTLLQKSQKKKKVKARKQRKQAKASKKKNRK